ncbi:hypothetical protein FHX49_000653 [Microbacterium endophyticum]|uniref:Uncharacterized protein n=1 Tax=Microbacterium endophyticum TaxID=1526412 RepID=A0A7W4YMH2_9MICO|nr:hypothetical protein [Microbacterium endophyticum]MBB2975112.1 hypothetical protein [Microbacterium endophyticum]NIK37348.1 hypothetical protein [Microbacterium endophyticum]
MVNQERPNELVAKQIVEERLGVELEHADTHGGVDYKSADGKIALEVTAVTQGGNKGARDALKKSVKKGVPGVDLATCWLVFAPEGQANMKTFIQRVQPALAELERVGESYFRRERAAIHTIEGGPLAEIYRTLLNAGVEMASSAPHEVKSDAPSHVHQVLVSTGSGGSVSGSDESLERLLDALSDKIDNPQKLAATGAVQRHLFVWVNDDTWHNIARPLSRTSPSWADEGWGAPSVAPTLDPAITHFWVMHERSRLGWFWDGKTWSALSPE